MGSSSVVRSTRSSQPVNFAGLLKIEASSGQSAETDFELRGFASQTVEERLRTHGAGAGWITYYRELTADETEWALHSGTSLAVYGLAGATGGSGNTILGSAVAMTQGTYPLTLAGTTTIATDHVITIYPTGNVYASYTGEAARPFSIDSFVKALHSALAQDPVVDGFKHAAEPILERAFTRESEKLGHWFQKLITEHPDSSKIADTLRLLARFKPYKQEWRHQIVSIALGSSSLDVRDAAIQAVEFMGGAGAYRLAPFA